MTSPCRAPCPEEEVVVEEGGAEGVAEAEADGAEDDEDDDDSRENDRERDPPAPPPPPPTLTWRSSPDWIPIDRSVAFPPPLDSDTGFGGNPVRTLLHAPRPRASSRAAWRSAHVASCGSNARSMRRPSLTRTASVKVKGEPTP